MASRLHQLMCHLLCCLLCHLLVSSAAVFNSWDRQPFLTNVGQKAPASDLNPAYNLIARNFFPGNYGASMAIDNDDGSSVRRHTN